jgi:NADH-quinone oxidoreductase subunit H
MRFLLKLTLLLLYIAFILVLGVALCHVLPLQALALLADKATGRWPSEPALAILNILKMFPFYVGLYIMGLVFCSIFIAYIVVVLGDLHRPLYMRMLVYHALLPISVYLGPYFVLGLHSNVWLPLTSADWYVRCGSVIIGIIISDVQSVLSWMIDELPINVLYFLEGLVSSLIAIAYYTLVERKLLASVQRRRGPNVVGFFGLLQPFADGLKLLSKELVAPATANLAIFTFAPVFSLYCTFILLFVVASFGGYKSVDLPFNLLFLFAVSSSSALGLIYAGWSSNSKYAFLGSIRTVSQMISYELSLSMIFVTMILMTSDATLTAIVAAQKHIWFVLPLFPLWISFMIIALAETNRAPFDLPEAEAELVAGYNVEYSAIEFAMFFLAEYGNMIVMSVLSTIFFSGGWLPIKVFGIGIPGAISFAIKISLNAMLFVLVRAALPRYRYDQLMKLGWKTLFPLSFAFMIMTAGVIYALFGTL